MEETNFDEALAFLLAKDRRYHRDAYYFVREALEYTQKLVNPETSGPRHVTGQQLLEGIRQYALKQFGPMTLTVFGEWGVHRSEDFGEIVFNMIESGLLAKTPQDSRADFANGYDFEVAFRQPFLPKSKVGAPRASGPIRSHANDSVTVPPPPPGTSDRS